MPRIRTIKPDAFKSDSLSSVPRGVRWTFAGLWTYADDEGRGRDDARLIAAELYPLDDEMDADEVQEDLRLLAAIGGICRYRVGGRAYFHVPNWEHQKINRPTPSRLPECPKGEHVEASSDDSLSNHGRITEPSPPERKGKEGEQGREGSSRELTLVETTRPEVLGLCELLAQRIEGNGSKRPNVTKRWLDAARLMLDSDGRTVEDVRGAIEWSQRDEFWRSNVLSMPKLREKFDQMRLQAERRSGQRRGDIDWDLAMDRARAMGGGQ